MKKLLLMVVLASGLGVGRSAYSYDIALKNETKFRAAMHLHLKSALCKDTDKLLEPGGTHREKVGACMVTKVTAKVHIPRIQRQTAMQETVVVEARPYIGPRTGTSLDTYVLMERSARDGVLVFGIERR